MKRIDLANVNWKRYFMNIVHVTLISWIIEGILAICSVPLIGILIGGIAASISAVVLLPSWENAK